MYKSQFYQDENGDKPFSEWLARLKKKDLIAAVKIDTRLNQGTLETTSLKGMASGRYVLIMVPAIECTTP